MRKIYVLLSALLWSASAMASSTVAYIYSSTNDWNGTNVYDAASDGKVTLVKGSPFATLGTMVGTNGKFFVTQGLDYVFSYAVESNGGIGKLVSEINTQLYSGVQCGIDANYSGQAELDHTGEYVYIMLNSDGSCAAIQTYKISNKGVLTFEGSTLLPYAYASLPAVTGNEKFAAGFNGCCGFYKYQRESSDGVLNYITATETDPFEAQPGVNPTPDPTDHLATIVQGDGYWQLASYTVDSHGDVESTNTDAEMPILEEDWNALKLDPTGKYLAVAIGTGVALYHFNGAKPITPFTNVIGDSGYVQYMAWDNSGHLYAVNGASGRLHVYTVTSKGITESKDSPTASGLFLSGPIVVRAE